MEVQILYHGRRFLGATGNNLSNQGMYLDVQHLTLPVGTLVELELDWLGERRQIEAIVVHRNSRGIGVMFREPQPQMYQALTQDAAAIPPPPAVGVGNLRPRLARN